MRSGWSKPLTERAHAARRLVAPMGGVAPLAASPVLCGPALCGGRLPTVGALQSQLYRDYGGFNGRAVSVARCLYPFRRLKRAHEKRTKTSLCLLSR